MCLFDQFLVWKTDTSKPSEIDVHVYQDIEEINNDDLDDFSNEKYTLHDKTDYLAEIPIRKTCIGVLSRCFGLNHTHEQRVKDNEARSVPALLFGSNIGRIWNEPIHFSQLVITPPLKWFECHPVEGNSIITMHSLNRIQTLMLTNWLHTA